jgi:hypothetical protein
MSSIRGLAMKGILMLPPLPLRQPARSLCFFFFCEPARLNIPIRLKQRPADPANPGKERFPPLLLIVIV